jgi:HEAT repeat protein
MLDTAFEALKKFDWGTDLAVLNPIEDAVIASHGKPEAAKELENRLVASLQGELSRDAREYVCRKLAAIGTAASVPALSALLLKSDSSHMARFALERITAPEAAQALREALSQASGGVKIGVIGSLGGRRDSAAVAALAKLLQDADLTIARAAALALGSIGTAEAASALQLALKSSSLNPQTLIDSILSCAESLLAGNQRAASMAIYQAFAGESQSRLVRLAATRGLLACAGKDA